MKNVIISGILAMCLVLSISAAVRTDATEETKEVYCQIVGTSKLLSSKVTVQVDYGQERNFFGIVKIMKDEETGKNQNFNSMIDALNYMGDQDWKFVNAYTVTVGNQNVYHYVLKKTVPKSLE